MDFLAITDPAQYVTLYGQRIERPRFGLHLRLGQLAQFIVEAIGEGRADKADILIKHYFKESGLDTSELSGTEQLSCLVSLFQLNSIKALFAFQTFVNEKIEPPPYDYAGRNWTWWVHKLATRYGWTADYIFSLWPEEAAAYLQEVIISEYDELDERRSLSQLAYKYNNVTKESKFHPIPRPAWMKEKKNEKPNTRRIRRDMLPVGNIIDLRGKTQDDVELLQ